MGTVAKVRGSAVYGIEAIPISIEVQTQNGGTRHFQIIGLGDNSVKESRERVCSAISYSGFELPSRILVNLAPADLKKEGGGFDLPIAIGILLASNQISAEMVQGLTFIGELSLNGELKPIKGAVVSAIESMESHQSGIVLSHHNAREVGLVDSHHGIPCDSLSHVVSVLHGESSPTPIPANHLAVRDSTGSSELDGVIGQEVAKRALRIAAAGGHNILMIGPPGCGKSMLAERFSSLLPPMTQQEVLESVKIYSIAGLPIESLLEGKRPFRAPHYVVSEAGLVGGGSPPRPGEITLAHNGVLFLDELPEYRRGALEALRLPLESGELNISRAKGAITFPARFQLLAAMNPCPCGRLGTNDKKNRCRCTQYEINNYLRKLSQPILDRIDLHVELSAIPLHALTEDTPVASEYSRDYEVLKARETQLARFGVLNAFLTREEISTTIVLNNQSRELLLSACEKLQLSARGYIRVLRVARTIADLSDSETIDSVHISEALSYRGLERLRSLKCGVV